MKRRGPRRSSKDAFTEVMVRAKLAQALKTAIDGAAIIDCGRAAHVTIAMVDSAEVALFALALSAESKVVGQ